MKILFISNGYPSSIYPSKTVFLQRLVNEIADLGHICTVIAPNPIPKNHSIPEKYQMQKTQLGKTVRVFIPNYLKIWFSAKIKKDPFKRISFHNYYKTVLKTIKKEKIEFDIIYAHFLGAAAYSAVKIGKKKKLYQFLQQPEKAHFHILMNLIKYIQ